MAARETHVHVAAELRGPATRNGAEDRVLLGGQDMASPERRAVLANDVRKLEGRTCRRARRCARIGQASVAAVAWPCAEVIERAGQGLHPRGGDVQVDRGALHRRMAKQDL